MMITMGERRSRSSTALPPPMTRTTPTLRIAAERLLKLEGHGTRTRPTAVVVKRLGRVLITLLGAAGFKALLARAVTLAKAEAPASGALQIAADGSLVGLSENDDLADGEVVLVAHVLGLLVRFVGEGLMLRLVNDAWPKARLGDLDLHKDEP